MGTKEVTESPHPETPCVAPDLGLVIPSEQNEQHLVKLPLPKMSLWNYRVARGAGDRWEPVKHIKIF